MADHIGIGWDAVKEIHQEALEKKYAAIPLMAVFSDLKTGKVIHAVEVIDLRTLVPLDITTITR